MDEDRTPAPSTPMPLCTSCGVIGTTQADTCPHCGSEHPRPIPRVPRPIRHAWVAVRCSFQCRSCHFLSPLDEFDVDGSVECAQCGQSQRFDVQAWNDALDHAHALADLAYPQPQGRYLHPDIWIETPFPDIGRTEVFDEHRQSGTETRDGVTIERSLFIEVGPGHPICRACKRALDVEIDPQGQTRTRCSGCGNSASYELPPGGDQFTDALVGIVGEAHRSDQRRARMESSAGGPIALKCPECAGALPATRERVLTCTYCGTASLIPAQARTRDAGQVLEPDVWWVAFRGPSPRRAALESPPIETVEGEKEGVALFGPPKPDTRLELGKPLGRRYWLQMVVDLGLPTIALIIAIILVVLFGLGFEAPQKAPR